MSVGAREEPGGEGIGVVYTEHLSREISDANTLTVGKLAEVVKDVLAATHCYFQAVGPLELLISVQKRLTDK
jgi:hypothetical protein